MSTPVSGHRVTYECPICFEQLLPPIFQCYNGHLLCEVCIGKVDKCPICREEMPKERKIRALELENIIQTLDLPCPFAKDGCQLLLKYGQIGSHKLDCQYASMDYCTKIGLSGVPGCEVGGKVGVRDLVGHLQAVHRMTEANLISLKLGEKYTRLCPMTAAGASTWEQAVVFCEYNSAKRFHSVKFFFKIGWDPERASWIPYLMGSENSCEPYRCKIKLESRQKGTSLEWEGPVFSPESSPEKLKTALTLSVDYIRGFDQSDSAINDGGKYSVVISFYKPK